MCGRYTLSKVEGLGERYDAFTKPLPPFEISYNIAPGSTNPVVARMSPNGIYMMKWGLIPFWAKDPQIGYKMINARSEDIENKPSFRKPIRTQRCLVPTTGFYEWSRIKLEDKEEKYPWYFKISDQTIFSLAGIYDKWEDAEGRETFSYSIITTAPNNTVKKIHNRMPVILPLEKENEYLNPNTELEKILQMLAPFADNKMESWPASPLVNSPDNNNSTLPERHSVSKSP